MSFDLTKSTRAGSAVPREGRQDLAYQVEGKDLDRRHREVAAGKRLEKLAEAVAERAAEERAASLVKELAASEAVGEADREGVDDEAEAYAYEVDPFVGTEVAFAYQEASLA